VWPISLWPIWFVTDIDVIRKISYKYDSMLTYIPVSFLFSFKKGFGLGLKIGLGLG